MKHLANRRTILPAALLAASCAMAMLVAFRPGAADAQRKPEPPKVLEITYGATYVEGITPTGKDDEMEAIHIFPETPVFMIRTKRAVTVWERRGKKLVSLLEIKLDEEFKELLLLGDNQSFIIRTKASARVYSINMIKRMVPDTSS